MYERFKKLVETRQNNALSHTSTQSRGPEGREHWEFYILYAQ